MQKCDVSICDHQGKQEILGERLPRQTLATIDVISAPGTTFDGGKVCIVWKSAHDQPENQGELDESRLAQSLMVIDVNNAPGVLKDSEIVQNQSETTLRS